MESERDEARVEVTRLERILRGAEEAIIDLHHERDRLRAVLTIYGDKENWVKRRVNQFTVWEWDGPSEDPKVIAYEALGDE